MSAYATSRQLAESVKRRIKYGVTQQTLAKEFGISQGYLCDFLRGNREAGPKILAALGYDAKPHYRKAQP